MLLQMNQHGGVLQKRLWVTHEAAVCGRACPSQQAWDGQAASWAWSRANQKIQKKMVLGSESCCVFSDLTMGSCICSGLTPFFVNFIMASIKSQ